MQFALLLAAADASTLSSLRGGAAPTQLITSAGELQAAPIAEVVDGGAQMAVVASVGGKGAGRALLNALFDTEFDASALGEAPGAWVSGSPSSPGVLLLDTEGAPAPPPPEGKAKPKGAPADACKLASFSFALADAVLVHAPCVAPSADELRAAYEEYFTQHLSVLSSKEGAPPAARTLLVHVAAAGEDGGESAWRDAAAAAWAAAVAPTELKDAEMGAHFDLEYAALPHPKLQPAEFAAAAAELSARLRSLRGSEYSKDLRPATFGGAAAAAWKSASSALDGQPPAAWLKERFWAARAYEGGYAVGQSKIAPMAKLVGRDKVVVDFGAKAGALVADAMATFDGGVADCGDGAAALIAQRRGRLLKALHADVAELFSKQNRLITVKAVEKYKAGLLNAVARAGKVEEWQLESLRGAAERWCAAAPAPAPPRRAAAAPPPNPPHPFAAASASAQVRQPAAPVVRGGARRPDRGRAHRVVQPYAHRHRYQVPRESRRPARGDRGDAPQDGGRRQGAPRPALRPLARRRRPLEVVRRPGRRPVVRRLHVGPQLGAPDVLERRQRPQPGRHRPPLLPLAAEAQLRHCPLRWSTGRRERTHAARRRVV